MYDDSIEECIQRIKHGDRSAFRSIIEKYQKPLIRYITYMIHDECDDIVQEVFIKAYTSINSYRSNTNFEAWLYKIAYNHTMSILKKKTKDVEMMHEWIFHNKHSNQANQGFSEPIKDVLRQLKANERALLYFKIYEELSYKDISKILKKLSLIHIS